MWNLAPWLSLGGTGGAVALLMYVGRLLLSGRLVPVKTHERELELLRSLITSKQERIDRLEAALTQVEAQRDKLLGVAVATAEVVQALPKAKDAAL